ncbi:uncharacterized protein LOC117331059 [Pecten maximus]|uniref:uncharacterized protein LOC117331059 n=1 Tax=Pecten maximus TaxID=6579 RepID=UPI0014587EEC|nr:uncharacterized protein LOC117331059 [Pecten maximus]
MVANESHRDERNWNLPFLLYVLFIFHEGVYAKEECQTAYDGIIECETGCCGEHWRNNVSCCPFHPAAFIMIVMAIMLVIVFVAFCIISSTKRCNRSKTVIKPDVSDDSKEVPFISYFVVAPGIRDKTILSPYSDSQEWRYYYTTRPQRPHHLPE